MKKLCALLLVCAALASGCQPRRIQPLNTVRADLDADEKRIWRQAEREQEKLFASGFILDDPELERYLQGVVNRLIPPQSCAHLQFRIKVIKDPSLNAITYPNGLICVHSGMLARFENEAQLAAVIAHETVHATNRHTVLRIRDIKNKSAVYSAMGLGSASPGRKKLIPFLGVLGLASSVAGFSRDLEREADQQGFALMLKAGYAPGESVKAFEHLKAWMKEMDHKESRFFFESHPDLDDRIKNFQAMVQSPPASGGGGEVFREPYQAAAAKVILLDAGLNLDEGAFEQAEKEAARFLEAHPENVQALCLLGDIRLERGGEGDLQKASECFQKVVQAASSHAPAHRGLGICLLKSGDCPKAREAFQAYLDLSPNAPDKSFVTQYMEGCTP